MVGKVRRCRRMPVVLSYRDGRRGYAGGKRRWRARLSSHAEDGR